MVRNPDPLEMRLVLNAGLDDRDNELTTCRESWIRFRFVLIAVAGWMNQRQLQILITAYRTSHVRHNPG